MYTSTKALHAGQLRLVTIEYDPSMIAGLRSSSRSWSAPHISSVLQCQQFIVWTLVSDSHGMDERVLLQDPCNMFGLTVSLCVCFYTGSC